MTDIAARVADLTTEQKASLVTGASFWHTAAVPSAGIPAITVSDGPHGLRHQSGAADHLAGLAADPATCFPPAVALASTWNPDLAHRVGTAIAREAVAAGVSVVLGPGINITRSVRCGRNFEYFSEDPLLAGVFGAAWVEGLQSQGVGASLKHFAANNQETDRLRISAEVDERTLHEIYLRAFEHVVRTARPWTVMCAYNAINGVFAAENRWLLTELLRECWGFEGLVVSDWGAVHDRVEALRAGLDLEMPGTASASAVVGAVAAGELGEDLDTSVRRVLQLVERSQPALDDDASYDTDAHHELAAQVAREAVVLLRNDGTLPLDPGRESIAVIGEFARTPRYQGAGSSQIVPTRLDDPLTAIRERAEGAGVQFAPGFRLDGSEDDAALAEAVEAAAAADIAVVFVGLPDRAESEGFDRPDIELPPEQVQVLTAVLDTGTPVVVVLSGGSVVRVSDWSARTAALVQGWLLGQAGGTALAAVLFGDWDASGRLAQSIPRRLEDTCDYLDFPGGERRIRYGEGVFVGYRWYDGRDLPVAYPFGHGLSYTTFVYGEPALERDGEDLVVVVEVRNTGGRDGIETVQVYAGLPGSQVPRPPRVLAGFTKVAIAAGAVERVRVPVPVTALRYWSIAAHDWRVEPGEYQLHVGSSSRDLPRLVSIRLEGDGPAYPLTVDSTIGEWLADPAAGPPLREVLTGTIADPDGDVGRMLTQSPVRGVAAMSGGALDLAWLERLAAAARGAARQP